MAALPDPIPDLSGEGRRIYDDILARRKAKGVNHLGPYVPLLNHPELAKDIERLGYFYKFESKLPRDVYQFIVLSMAVRSGVSFVWADHVAAARAAGLPDAVIDGIKAKAGGYPAPFDDVQATTDCAFRFVSIPADLQERVIARFGMHGFIEIVTLCGFYTMIGMVNVCFDVPLPHHGEH
ncbi:carboxymuconolactone decarboxylase [Bauldia sp.]|uniref:carboxymuconolactone decarboxylase n=1 Tax=Bauldia sp. TaxID=2575872 RepID=UPI003BAB5B41